MTGEYATPEQQEWRRSLREAMSRPLPDAPTAAGFGPVPERVEITAVFECVCDGTCPEGCIHCIACSGRPAGDSSDGEDRVDSGGDRAT